ncbi:MAG TPA: protein kinase [Ktedonobacteraceae bacterium]|nr:protein kinase [Ktedonobacteraceae bacterium]
MALPIGTVLDGKFKIVQILGEGGMGTVYKVEQVGTPPGSSPYYYAVKELLISPNTSEEDRKAAIERFNKEIDLLRGLKHPRIAALALRFQDRGNYYFAMEFVPGRSLEKILEDTKGPLPETQVVKWMMQVCEALTYIHTRNPPIILRDLKPGNIMITPDDEVQLIDFGIARRFDPNKRTNTENLGTISYASPEHLGSITAPGQRRSAQNPGKLVQTDARSDIYSLGATMYHLLTNYEPDPIQTPAQGSILAKNPRLRTVQVNGKVVCPVEQVIIKAMQQEPAQRFQSAEAMRMALQQCLPQQAAPSTVQIPAMSPNATIIVQPAATITSGSTVSAGVGLICPKCGLQNRPGAKFCKRDGQPLVQGAAIAPPQIRTQAARVAVPPPVNRPIQARPSQPVAPIRARPVQPQAAIKARPVSTNGNLSAYRLGLQNLTSKNFVEAINQFKLAQSQSGSSYDVLYNLGRAYRQYGQSVRDSNKKLFSENMKHAAEYFEEATRLKTDALDAFFQLGMCYRDLSLYPQATTVFKKALSLAPQDPAVYYQLGLVAMEQGLNREAETNFLEGLRLNPDHALILIALGRLYITTKRIADAISTLRQATQRDEALWEGWYELGRAHMRAKEWKFALSALERARQVGSYAPEIYSAMATCYLKLNKKVEARQMVNETLQRDPNNAEAIRLQKQI